jgi:hypothetical protein
VFRSIIQIVPLDGLYLGRINPRAARSALVVECSHKKASTEPLKHKTMKSFSVIALLSALSSLSLAQESFPGAEFRILFNFTDLSSSADLSQPFGVSLF